MYWFNTDSGGPMNETAGTVVVPLVVALLPLLWRLTASYFQRHQFRSLILREIEEVGPYPEKREGTTNQESWTAHHSEKRFIHQEILADPTANRDFILSLPSSLTYYVAQLWQSTSNADQWLYMLWAIRGEVPFWMTEQKTKLGTVAVKWYDLIRSYGIRITEDNERLILDLKAELADQKTTNRARHAG
jgi:hypothetical protein